MASFGTYRVFATCLQNAVYSLVNWFSLDDKTEHCLAATAKKNVDVD